MGEELHNDQAGKNICSDCLKDPCVCPDKDEKSKDNGKTTKKLPKISWI